MLPTCLERQRPGGLEHSQCHCLGLIKSNTPACVFSLFLHLFPSSSLSNPPPPSLTLFLPLPLSSPIPPPPSPLLPPLTFLHADKGDGVLSYKLRGESCLVSYSEADEAEVRDRDGEVHGRVPPRAQSCGREPEQLLYSPSIPRQLKAPMNR